MIKRILLGFALLLSVQAHATPLPKTFTWASSGDANTLDPYGIFEVPTLSFLSNIYEPLVRRNKDMKLDAALAVKWELKNPTTWRFELRKDVVFHDGSPFTADDVVFSFKRARGKGSDLANKLSLVKEVKKIDSHTVEFTTNGPAPILPDELTQWFIMCEKWCKEHKTEMVPNYRQGVEGHSTRHTNGTGPFKVTVRKQDEETVLEPHTKWWDKSEFNFDRAVFKIIPSAQTRVASLLSGQVDVVFPVPLQDIDRIKASKEHDVMQGDELRTIFLGLNQWQDELADSNVKGKNPFNDLRVRKAMYHAINIDALAKKIMRGAASPTGLIYSPALQGADPSLNTRLPYDIKKAKDLMKEAGYEKGFSITLDAPNDRYVSDEDIAKAIASMLAKIDIKVNLNVQPKSKFFPKILKNQSSFYLFGWTAMSLDAYDPITNVMQTSKGGGKGLFNLAKYSNEKIDVLADKIQVETDMKKRNDMIREATLIMKEDVGYIPLHQQKLAWGHKKNISMTQRPDDYFCLRWVKIN